MPSGVRAMGCLVLLALGSCDAEDDARPAAPKNRQELGQAMAQILCKSRAECCSRESFEFDTVACEADLDSRLQAILEADAAAGSYDSKVAAACLKSVTARVVCGEADDAGNVLEDCENIFHGDVAPGEACESHTDCRVAVGQRPRCADAGQCRVATLAQATRGRPGDACESTCPAEECIVESAAVPAEPGDPGLGVGCFRDDGLYCDTRCRELAALSDPCSDDGECVEGAFCDMRPPTPIQDATCSPLLELGDDCFPAPQACRSGHCDEESFLCAEPQTLSAADCSDYSP